MLRVQNYEKISIIKRIILFYFKNSCAHANDWAREHQKPRYILDLLLSVINVSVQTVDIVDNLPKLKFD